MYCLNCGKSIGVFDMRDQPEPGRCVYHSDRKAKAYCACCANPICAGCEGRRGFSFFGHFDTPHCRHCLETMSQIEGDFLARLDRHKICAKHPDQPARFRCKVCGLLHCDYCLYFVTKGIFRIGIARGPYCLTCFRMETLDGGRRRWISLYRARLEKMVILGG
jgi:hypothetical protein